MKNNAYPSPKRFLSVVEAAGYIDRHRSTLDKWRAENIVLPFYKDNDKIMYAIDDLDDYLQSCRVEPVAYGLRQSHLHEELNNMLATTTAESPPVQVADDAEASGDA